MEWGLVGEERDMVNGWELAAFLAWIHGVFVMAVGRLVFAEEGDTPAAGGDTRIR